MRRLALLHMHIPGRFPQADHHSSLRVPAAEGYKALARMHGCNSLPRSAGWAAALGESVLGHRDAAAAALPTTHRCTCPPPRRAANRPRSGRPSAAGLRVQCQGVSREIWFRSMCRRRNRAWAVGWCDSDSHVCLRLRCCAPSRPRQSTWRRLGRQGRWPVAGVPDAGQKACVHNADSGSRSVLQKTNKHYFWGGLLKHNRSAKQRRLPCGSAQMKPGRAAVDQALRIYKGSTTCHKCRCRAKNLHAQQPRHNHRVRVKDKTPSRNTQELKKAHTAHANKNNILALVLTPNSSTACSAAQGWRTCSWASRVRYQPPSCTCSQGRTDVHTVQSAHGSWHVADGTTGISSCGHKASEYLPGEAANDLRKSVILGV